jgi:Tol biopolymer transport system component
MSATHDLESGLRAMLAETAPRREPDQLFDAVMSVTATVRQRPRLLAGPPVGGVAARAPGANRLGLAFAALLTILAVIGGAILAGIGGTRDLVIAPSSSSSASPRVSPSPSPIAILPGESWILYERFTQLGGGLFLMRPDGSDDHQILTAQGGRLHQSDWSPDGRRVVYMDELTDQLSIASVDGSSVSLVETCKSGGCGNPAWSPDGTKIAFSRVEGGAAVGPGAVGIEILDLASGKVTKVIRLARPLLADVPRWSPDGKQLVIGVDQMDDQANETGAAIATVPAAGGTLTYLTKFADFAYSPDWSPVDNRIVFAPQVKPEPRTGSPGTWNLFTIKADGSGLRQVTHVATGSHLWGAAWSRDGRRILAGNQGQRIGVFVDPTTGAIEPIGGTDFAFGHLRPSP